MPRSNQGSKRARIESQVKEAEVPEVTLTKQSGLEKSED